MRISVRVLHYTQKKYADGSFPIVLQYRVNGKVKKKTLAKCKEDEWDDKNKRVKSKVKHAARINHFIASELAKAEKEVYNIKSGESQVADLFEIKNKLSLDQAFDMELKRLEQEFKSGYFDKILAIRKQIKDTSIDISSIDEKWFEKMIKDLTLIGNSANTIKKKIKLIRGMIGRYSHKGITNDVKAVTIAVPKTLKQKLNDDELTRLEALRLPEDDLISATRDIFLMQIYLRGIRIGDILQAYAKDFKDGRFSYYADKTDKAMSIKLISRAQEIVDRYTGKYPRLFPFFKWEPVKNKTKFENERDRLKHKEVCTSVINRHLKVLATMAQIDKPLSSHIARHTFARMAIDKINNPMITMELLGHSGLAVHQQYLNDIRKDDVLDQASEDIFG